MSSSVTGSGVIVESSWFMIMLICLLNGLLVSMVFIYSMYLPHVADFYGETMPHVTALGLISLGCFMVSGIAVNAGGIALWMGGVTYKTAKNLMYFISLLGLWGWCVVCGVLGYHTYDSYIFAVLVALLSVGAGFFYWSTFYNCLYDIIHSKNEVEKKVLALSFAVSPFVVYFCLIPASSYIMFDSELNETTDVTSAVYPHRFALLFQNIIITAGMLTVLYTGAAVRYMWLHADNFVSTLSQIKFDLRPAGKRGQAGKRDQTVVPAEPAKPKASADNENQDDVDTTKAGAREQRVMNQTIEWNELREMGVFGLLLIANAFLSFSVASTLLFSSGYMASLDFGDDQNAIVNAVPMCIAGGAFTGCSISVMLASIEQKGSKRQYTWSFLYAIVTSMVGFISVGCWYELAFTPTPNYVRACVNAFFLGMSILTQFWDGFSATYLYYTAFTLEIRLTLMSLVYVVGIFAWLAPTFLGDWQSPLNTVIDYETIALYGIIFFSISFTANLASRGFKEKGVMECIGKTLEAQG